MAIFTDAAGAAAVEVAEGVHARLPMHGACADSNDDACETADVAEVAAVAESAKR